MHPVIYDWSLRGIFAVNQAEQSGHMAWCALMALAIARVDSSVKSVAQENIFLTRWLAMALKQRRFPRDVNPNVEWLLNQGRQFGFKGSRANMLDYLWQSSTGSLTEQSDHYRFCYVLKMAREMQ